MSEPDHFLSRWSRRKRQPADESKAATAAGPTAEDGPATADAPRRPLPKVEEAAFDPALLPAIDSITADTDIRGFFAPGVPAELTRAALRRAWTADPRIREFVGLAENDWDFNNPGSIPGFGSLEMTPELRREVERIVGGVLPQEEQPGRPPAAPSTQPPEPARQIAAAPKPTLPEKAANTAPVPDNPARGTDELLSNENTLHRTQDHTAVQHSAQSQESLQTPARRGHGGALPK